MSQHQSIEIRIESRVEYVNLIHAACEEVCRLLNFDADTAMNMSLAIHEAAVNAVKHGNRLDARKIVRVAFIVRPGALEIRIEDQGEGFDLENVQDPCNGTNIERTNGRGIFLMRNFMDQVEFRCVPGKGTTVSLVKKLPEPGERHGDGGR